jgi:hypothetical protein
MKFKFLKNLACSVAAFSVFGTSALANFNPAILQNPEYLQRVQYVINASLQNPNMASAYAQNFLGLAPDFRLNAAAQTGNAEYLRNAIYQTFYEAQQAYNQQLYIQQQKSIATPKVIQEPYVDPTSSYGGVSSLGLSTTSLTLIGVGAAGAIALAAGSGGGSSSSSGGGSTTTFTKCSSTGTTFGLCPTIASTSSFQTTEYGTVYTGDTQNMLSGIKAEYAYARGITGAGVKIGIIDGFSTSVSSNSELLGKVAYTSLNSSNDEDAEIDYNDDDIVDAYHGNEVAKFAAGKKNSASSHGVAYDSELLLQTYYSSSTDAQILDNLANRGAKVVNFSLGLLTTSVSSDDLEFMQAAKDNDVVLTIAAGNYCNDTDATNVTNCVNPAYPARAVTSTEAGGVAIAVGAVEFSGSAYTITDFSNKAGDAANYFITVPTTWGTSAAAPGVAGAAALVRQAWPHLTAAQTVQVLLTSATDLGTTGTDSTYGRGMLNLQTAFTPLVSSSVLSSSGTTGVSLSSSFLQPSKVFGNAFNKSNNTISFADGFNRVFQADTNNYIDNSARQTSTSYVGALQRLGFKGKQKEIKGDGFSINFSEFVTSNFDENKSSDENNKIAATAKFAANDNVEFTMGYGADGGAALVDDYYNSNKNSLIKPEANFVPYLNMYDYDASFAGIKTEFEDNSNLNINFVYGRERENALVSNFNEARSMASILNYNKKLNDGFGHDIKLGFTNGFLHEDGSVLGSKTGGAFDVKDGATTIFFGTDFKFDITEDVAISANAYKGFTNAKPSKNSIYSDFSNIETESFGAGIESKNNFTKNDSVLLSIFQGLRVNGGTVKGAFFGQAPDGSYIRNNFEQSLEPEGREMTVQALYNLDVTEKVDVSLAAQATENPNNNSAAKREQAVLGKLRVELD